MTAIDALYINLEEENITSASIQKLHKFVLNESFDTDALRDDIMECSDDNPSNAFAVIGNDEKCVKKLTSFFEELFSMYSLHISILALNICIF